MDGRHINGKGLMLPETQLRIDKKVNLIPEFTHLCFFMA